MVSNIWILKKSCCTVFVQPCSATKKIKYYRIEHIPQIESNQWNLDQTAACLLRITEAKKAAFSYALTFQYNPSQQLTYRIPDDNKSEIYCL